MGICSSSPTTRVLKPDSRFHDADKLMTVRIVWMDGKVEEHKQRVRAGNVIPRSGNHQDLFLCSSEHLAINSCPPPVQDEEELQVGHIYFLLPLSWAYTPLSLADLCDLAIKALSSTHSDGRNR